MTRNPIVNQDDVRLPENAFRELKPGETYEPVIPARAMHAGSDASARFFRASLWSIIFSAAATYIALKLGQGIESAIPISILAVGFSVFAVKFMKRRASTLLENVNVLAIGATSGIIAGGSVFTMPAIYILGLENRSSFFQIFLVPLLGAFLGIFFLAPFRRYFVRDLHGKLPYPEARATTEILMAGKRGGHSAIVLSYSAVTAALFDFVGPSMRAWAENFSTGAIGAMSGFTNKYKAVFTMNTSAAVLGLGYIMGLDYASIILAGSFVSFFVLVPLFAYLGQYIPGALAAGAAPLAQMPAEDIFFQYVRPIGIGGIFAAGIISIVKMSPVIVQATRQAMGEIVRLVQKKGVGAAVERTDRALPDVRGPARNRRHRPPGISLFPLFGSGGDERRDETCVDIGSADARHRISVRRRFGVGDRDDLDYADLRHDADHADRHGGRALGARIERRVRHAAGSADRRRRLHGAVDVRIAGDPVQDRLLARRHAADGSRSAIWSERSPHPRRPPRSFFSCRRVYGFAPGPGHPNPLPAPQPNAMAAVLRGVMAAEGAPWFLYALGAVFAVVVAMCGVSALAFALGMYLPMELNSPLVLGRSGRMVPAAFVEKQGAEQGAARERDSDCIRLHRRRSAGRRAGRAAAVYRRFLESDAYPRSCKSPGHGWRSGTTGSA